LSSLTSNTAPFIKGDVYGAKKKKKLKRGISTTMDGTTFKNIPGSFSKQLRTKTGRKK
jgi:hypothetical protein|tara:strand:+ start:1379 stop:1552 length:174 start_codon:yes stop_codon:yes gene_type:complete